jgi:hypothetical protein
MCSITGARRERGWRRAFKANEKKRERAQQTKVTVKKKQREKIALLSFWLFGQKVRKEREERDGSDRCENLREREGEREREVGEIKRVWTCQICLFLLDKENPQDETHSKEYVQRVEEECHEKREGERERGAKEIEVCCL